MTTSVMTLDSEPVTLPRARPASPRLRRVLREAAVYLGLAVLLGALWWVSRQGWYRAGDRVGYWMGVAGGVMMLLLFLYPMRKHLRFAQRWGKVKGWFVVHMLLGIGGPALILLHSTFEMRSVNAAVAMTSMLVVAGSGVIGRFLYLQVYRGLSGERGNLAELQRQLGLADSEFRSRFRFAPGVAECLLAFEADALTPRSPARAAWHALVLLPIRRRLCDRACALELRERLLIIGNERRWAPRQVRSRYRQARAHTQGYLRTMVRVAQFGTYERVFALWHLLHLPFVYLLVITAAFHVFAVHAY